jgi:prevent-host-death family protein
MAQVNIYEAKTHFSRLIARVLAGEEIVVARAGKALIKLVPVDPPPTGRVAGSLAGQIEIADDFDDPLPPEIQGSFEDGPLEPEAE